MLHPIQKCRGTSLFGRVKQKQKKRQQPTVEIGEIAAVLIDGDATLKHFYRDGDSVTLVSSNPKYKPMVYHKDDCDDIRILGKAVAYLHDLE